MKTFRASFLTRTTILLGALSLASCGGETAQDSGPQPCTDAWFQLVEANLSIGDAQGHGPDLGSSEWRSAVEFKLGIRGTPGIPDVATEEWCIYIDEEMSRSAQ